MRRFFTLVCLLCLAIPAGISISGCTRNPAANYCNGLGYGLKIGDLASIDLEPRTTGISLAFGQTQQVSSPSAKDCKGNAATAGTYTYGTTNNQLVDISPTGNICAGTWNRNSGGGIADFTICNKPNPVPSTGGLPYSTAYVTAEANSVTSNPLEVYVHAQVTSISLALNSQAQGQQQCYSQGVIAQLDAQAYYSNNGTQTLLCSSKHRSLAPRRSARLLTRLAQTQWLQSIPRDQPDHRRATGNHRDYRFDSRVRVVCGLLLDLPAAIDLNHPQRKIGHNQPRDR